MYDEYGKPSGSGSGFFIEKEGIGITNYHVLNKAVKATIKTIDEEEFEIDTVLKSSEKMDLIVFRIKNPDKKKFKVIDIATDKPQKGKKVINISSPKGLGNSVSEGIISSFRENKGVCDYVQITAPISAGSSGSPILNENGKVFAVASFKINNAENLNFGVVISEKIIEAMENKDFAKNNPHFDNRDFVLLNVPDEKEPTMVLNAIEFSKTITTLYLTYTNLQLYREFSLLSKDTFYIEDVETQRKYQFSSSTLSAEQSKIDGKKLAKSINFKVYFPAIKNKPKQFSVEWGRYKFSDIDLDAYQSNFTIDRDNFMLESAMYTATTGEHKEAISELKTILDEKPDDALALNTLGIISFLIDNKSDAMDYFNTTIEKNPIDPLGFVNRAAMYEKQGEKDLAIEDVSSAINLIPNQSDYYLFRARLYISQEEYSKARTDLNEGLKYDRNNAYLYYSRAIANAFSGNRSAAIDDVRTAFRLSTDADLDARIRKLYDVL
jgi:serine protease Do